MNYPPSQLTILIIEYTYMKCHPAVIQRSKNYLQMSLSRHYLVEEYKRNPCPQTPLCIKEMQYTAFWNTTQLKFYWLHYIWYILKN
jgi:hypothetical protein